MMTVDDAITGRRSVRAYQKRAVPRETIAKILRVASRAPSGTNVQPWQVYVMQGERKEQLSAELVRLGKAGTTGKREYNYYPEEWREPYLARRRACGFGLYKTLGIGRDDKVRMQEQHLKNWTFFGAPVGMLFAIDSYLEKGSWLDFGMFLQSIMIAARAEGLETCPQAAFAYQPATVKQFAGIPDGYTLVCGMALGYEDKSDVVNSFVTEREPLDTFVTWID